MQTDLGEGGTIVLALGGGGPSIGLDRVPNTWRSSINRRRLQVELEDERKGAGLFKQKTKRRRK